mgnify:CR=1 FL=1
MDADSKITLIGYHDITGTDYISSFYLHGKEVGWEIVEKHSRFVNVFTHFGDSWNLSQESLNQLEE